MSAQASEIFEIKRDLFATARKAVPGDARQYWVPGRIEVLGKHTDYAGGRSLLCAVERGFALAAAPRSDARVKIRDLRRNETVEFEIAPDLVPTSGRWANYPMTVARRLAINFGGPWCGADIAFASDLPPAAGLSSSSALVTAIFLALSDVNDLPSREHYTLEIRRSEDLAGYLGCIENGQSFGALMGDSGVGTFGGSEDHTAILHAKPAALVQYSFCPVRFEQEIPLPAEHVFVVAFSGVAAEKTGAALEKYNHAARTTATILDLWRRASGRADATLAAAITAMPDAPARIRLMLQEVALRDRFEQFLEESTEVVPAAGAALARGDRAGFGRLVDYSMDLATRLLGNQIPETVLLARAARDLGAVAASAFGAGFGGSVWALIPADAVEGFRARWSGAFHANFPAAAARATFFATGAGPAACRL
ncbi:MAG: galactokinase [Gemmatimonadetes bacterium]|nr:galactokinase [Gemmatimonadota bacterium]